MKYNRFLTAGILVAMLTITWSCEDYLDQFRMDRLSTEMEVTPSLAAPLIYGSFSLQDVLEAMDSSGLVSQYPDSLLYLFYFDTAYAVNTDEVLILDDDPFKTETYIRNDIDIPEWNILPVGSEYTFTKVEKIAFEIEEGDKIDSVLLNGGFLSMYVFSEFQHSGTLTITSSNIFEPGGDTLNESFVISSTAGDFVETTDKPLDGYRLEFTEENDSAFVIIYFNLKLLKSPNGLVDGQEAGIELTFRELSFSKVFGQIAERDVIDITESIELDFFNSSIEIPDFYFADPQFNLYVHNSFGVQAMLDLSNVEARSSRDGSIHSLNFEPGLMPFVVQAPTIEQMGETVTSSLEISTQTSNIDTIISILPDKFDFSIKASTGSPDGTQNFVLDTSKMVVEAEIVLPLYLKTGGYTLQDTIRDVEFFETLGDLALVKEATVRLTTINEMPLEVVLQVYFLDQAEQVIDSLVKESGPFLEGAPVDANGVLLPDLVVPNDFDVTLTGEELEKLADTRHIWIKASARTSGDDVSVKFYSHYLLKYSMSIEGDFIINSNNLDIGSEE